MAEVEAPANRHPSRYTLLVAASATLSILAILMGAAAAAVFFFAPAPEVFTQLPVYLASNPSDAANWDFSNPHPKLHAGDQLVGNFQVCYRDVFGGSTVDVQGRRSIVSLDGSTRAVLNPVALTVSVGCHETRTVIDVIPLSFPVGTYRVSGMTVAITPYYSRHVDWFSVPFDVVADN